MDKKKIALILAFSILVLFILIYIFTPIKIGPGTPSQGLVEEAWEYCGQFNESNCNSNKFLDTTQYPAPINCYWNINTNNCDAGIGYQ